MPGKTTWTEEEHNTLVEMWRAGHTAAAIAATLGKSRNAVLGRAHRNGVSRNGALESWWRRTDDAGSEG